MSTPVTEQAAALQVEATSRALHLPTVRQQANALAEAALRDRLTHLAYLAEVLSAELDDRDARRRERRIHEARFPRLKLLADFDLAAAPTVDPAMLATLERGEWIAAGQPVVLLGDSGTGKSHLLIGLGMAACQRGLRVRYTTAAALVNELAEAADERTLSRVVARYGRLDLLCLDEFGYVHLDPRGRAALSSLRGIPASAGGPSVRSGVGGGRLQRPVLRSGARPSPTPASPPRSSTASRSTPTSSRPAASLTACGSPPPRGEVPPTSDHDHGGGVPIFFVKALGLLKPAELTPSSGRRLVVRDLRLIRRARAQHGQDDVAATTREADDCGVVSLPLGSLAVVERARDGVAQRGEGGEVHRVLEPVIAAAAPRLAPDAAAGLAGDRGKAGVAGQPRSVREARDVTDLGEHPCARPRPDPRQGAEDEAERVGLEELPDLRAEPLPPLLRAIQLGRDLGDHPTHRDRAGYDHGLGVEGPGDGLGERGREARRALPERPRPAVASACGVG